MFGLNPLVVAFLVFGGIAFVLFILSRGFDHPDGFFAQIAQITLHVLMVPLALLSLLMFTIAIFHLDANALRLQFSQIVSGQKNVSFLDAIPPDLQNTLNAAQVNRIDTDGDGFEEWLVFYEYDLKEVGSPVIGVIYDNDRGVPPVVFPYTLRIPDRVYLSANQRATDFALVQITSEPNGPNGEDLPELMVFDSTQLSMFRFNKENLLLHPNPAAPPNDNPVRYQTIGSFYGSGSVKYDEETKNVTVNDRDKFNRSQLAVRSVYALQTDGRYPSYWDSRLPLGSEEVLTLAPPVISTIDFYTTAPQDIFTTAYPEKTVLGFYASTCRNTDNSLCRNKNDGWRPEMFLAEGSEAWRADQNNDGSYFGLSSLNSNQSITVSDIRYYPRIESDSNEKLATGPTPQFNVVDVVFKAGNSPEQGLRFAMELVNGEWKIAKKLGPSNIPPENDFLPSAEDISEVGATLQ